METVSKSYSGSFSESLFRKLGNKFIEIYSGDSGVTRIYSQTQETMKEVIRGKFIGVDGELLILETISDPDKHVYVNGWNIKTVVELKDKAIRDVYDSESTRFIK